MQQIKRQRNNKKRKLIDQNKTYFEELANEIFYEIFEYLDMYDIYQGFFKLNKRFQNLLINSNYLIQINISIISKINLQHYYNDIIFPNKHRINFLRLLNPFIVDIIFSPPRIISKFIHLEKLILHNFKTKYLNNILKQLIFLPLLHSLILIPIDYIQNPNNLFYHIFRLTKLKYCQLTYQIDDNQELVPINFNDYNYSSIEYLILYTRFQFDSFDELLYCLPKLRYLSIDYLVDYNLTDMNIDRWILKHLKYVSIKVNFVYLNRLEKIIQNFFQRIRILRLTTNWDSTYLDAKKWQQLIVSSMPKLRIFDIYHENSIEMDQLIYHDLIHRFTSSFWIERQWFFTHKHIRKYGFDQTIFYSTNPYRRKDYIYNWKLDQSVSSTYQYRNLNSVKHVLICTNPKRNNSIYYFPNAIQLTLKDDFNIPIDSLTRILNGVVSLKKLQILIIDCYEFSFEQFIELLSATPNLHTFKCDVINFYQFHGNNDLIRYVVNTNQIKNIHINAWCMFEEIQMITNLFPRLEYLTIGIYRQDIIQIIRCLLSKMNNKTLNLMFLCILKIPKICLRKVNMLIKDEHLLDNYFLKYFNHDLYLWW